MNRYWGLQHGVRGKRTVLVRDRASGLRKFVNLQAAALAQDVPPGAQQVTVDALSVVKVRSKAVPDARSSATLGPQREGTGVVIDSSGLVMTIGYLVLEAENVELSTADGKVFPATVFAYDNATGLGLLKSLTPLPVKPVDIGQSESARRSASGADRRFRRRGAGLYRVEAPVRGQLGIHARRGDLHRAGDRQLERSCVVEP